MRFERIVDIYFKEDGDFHLGANGDLEDTLNYHYRGMIQRIDTRMKSGKGDWATQIELGAGLSSFLGRRNTEETAKAIKAKVYSELFQEDLLRPGEVLVEVLPVTNTKLAIVIIITPPSSEGQIVLSYTYDLKDNKVMLRNG